MKLYLAAVGISTILMLVAVALPGPTIGAYTHPLVTPLLVAAAIIGLSPLIIRRLRQ